MKNPFNQDKWHSLAYLTKSIDQGKLMERRSKVGGFGINSSGGGLSVEKDQRKRDMEQFIYETMEEGGGAVKKVRRNGLEKKGLSGPYEDQS